MKRFRIFRALPHAARPETRAYDAERRLAREWMERQGIYDVKPVYPASPAPQPAPAAGQAEHELTPVETLALLRKQAD